MNNKQLLFNLSLLLFSIPSFATPDWRPWNQNCTSILSAENREEAAGKTCTRTELLAIEQYKKMVGRPAR